MLFSPSLIRPLLATAARLAHAETVVWLCAPRRCELAWSILETTLPLTFARVERHTDQLHAAVPVAASLEVELWRCSGALATAVARPQPSMPRTASPDDAQNEQDDERSAKEEKRRKKKKKKRKRDDDELAAKPANAGNKK